MGTEMTQTPHPHLARRCAAVAAGLLSTTIWLLIYTALWQTHVTRHWLHHLILLTVGAGAFTLPCTGIWLLARCYDRARAFRGF